MSYLETPFKEFYTPDGSQENVSPGQQTFSIRDLCDAFAVTPRALRFYESQGLINPERDGQRRIYSLRDRARLFLVLRGKRFGFSLAELRELLDLYDLGDQQYTQLKKTLDSCYEKLEQMEERRRDIDAAIGDITSIIARLKATMDQMETDGSAKESAPTGPKARIFGDPTAALAANTDPESGAPSKG